MSEANTETGTGTENERAREKKRAKFVNGSPSCLTCLREWKMVVSHRVKVTDAFARLRAERMDAD